MSSSRWGAIFAFGLIVGGFTAVISLVWIVGLNYCPNGPCEYDSSPNQSPTGHEYWVPLATGPNTTSEPHPADAEGHESYYSHQDLRAQEGMARATNAIVKLTAASMFVGVVGAGLLIWTLVEQRKNNEISDSIRINQLRAYVVVTAAKIVNGEKCLRAAITVRNSGQTIASNVRREAGQYVGPIIPDSEMATVFPGNSTVPDLGPGQENTHYFDIEQDMITALHDAASGPTQLRYGGKIIYTDVFGEERETGYAYRTNAGEAIAPRSFHASAGGNYAT